MLEMLPIAPQRCAVMCSADKLPDVAIHHTDRRKLTAVNRLHGPIARGTIVRLGLRGLPPVDLRNLFNCGAFVCVLFFDFSAEEIVLACRLPCANWE